MKTAIFADSLDDKIQASAGSGSPPETNNTNAAPTSAEAPTSSDASTTPGAAPITEQVKSGDSYWTVAESALGFSGNRPLDRQQDQETFDLMKTLQSANDNAVLQPGDIVAVPASDLPQPPTGAGSPASGDSNASQSAPATNTAKGPYSWL